MKHPCLECGETLARAGILPHPLPSDSFEVVFVCKNSGCNRFSLLTLVILET